MLSDSSAIQKMLFLSITGLANQAFRNKKQYSVPALKIRVLHEMGQANELLSLIILSPFIFIILDPPSEIMDNPSILEPSDE